MQSSIIFLIFNRPDTTESVFRAIQEIKPSKLLVVADGPRANRIGEAEKCIAARAITEQINWDCEVLRNYSEINLGCAKRVSSGLTWAFDFVEEAIILEDDCVPHSSFFRYCNELLEHYRHDERIMSICGLSVPSSFKRDDSSYCFSKYQRCWGWASWRRAWQHYDHKMKLWPQAVEKNLLNELFSDKQVANFWLKKYQEVYEGKIDSWAYRWMFACWLQSGLSILPDVNLIANIGVSSDATHTINDGFAAQLTTEEMQFPLRHPSFILSDRQADLYVQRTRHSAGLGYRAKNKLKRLLKV